MKRVRHLIWLAIKALFKIGFLLGVPYLAYFVAAHYGYVRFNSFTPIFCLVLLFLICLCCLKTGAFALQSTILYKRSIGEIRFLSFIVLFVVLIGTLIPIVVTCRHKDTCITRHGLSVYFNF